MPKRAQLGKLQTEPLARDYSGARKRSSDNLKYWQVMGVATQAIYIGGMVIFIQSQPDLYWVTIIMAFIQFPTFGYCFYGIRRMGKGTETREIKIGILVCATLNFLSLNIIFGLAVLLIILRKAILSRVLGVD